MVRPTNSSLRKEMFLICFAHVGSTLSLALTLMKNIYNSSDGCLDSNLLRIFVKFLLSDGRSFQIVECVNQTRVTILPLFGVDPYLDPIVVFDEPLNAWAGQVEIETPTELLKHVSHSR